MWQLIIAAGAWLLQVFVSAAVVKAVSSLLFFFGIQYFINTFFGVGFLPSWLSISALTGAWSSVINAGNSLQSMDGDFGPRLWYVLNYMMIPYGLATMLNAQVTRFMIRRMFK